MIVGFFCTIFLKWVSGELPPGKFPPGELPPSKFPPGEFPPGKLPPDKSPPGRFPPEMFLVGEKRLSINKLVYYIVVLLSDFVTQSFFHLKYCYSPTSLGKRPWE